MTLQSKLLYTPTVNSRAEAALFGGVIWRSNFISDDDRRKCCINLTTVMSRVVFYYHNVIFRREIKLPYRWVVLDFDSVSPITSALCYSDWKYIIEFFVTSPGHDGATPSNLRQLFGAFLHIISTVYYSQTLFVVRTGGLTNRQTALDYLIQVSKHLLTHLPSLELTEVLAMEYLLLELKPSKVGNPCSLISERRFDFQVPGSVTYLYHTFQYCIHSTETVCDYCKQTHTAHKDHLRQFLSSVHPPSN